MQINKFSFVFHCLTTTQLLKDSVGKKLNTRNLIFYMRSFWIHDPLTIQAFHFTYMFIKIPFSNQNIFPLFNYGENTTYNSRN